MPTKTSRLPFNDSSNNRIHDNSVPKGILPDEEGPGKIRVALSWIKSRIRDLTDDKAVPQEQRDLLLLYYTREREKLQLKLRVFSETEKIKVLEGAVRKDDEVQKAGSERSLAEEVLIEARSALQKASTALEHLCRDDANWKRQRASARRWEQSREWQAVTPNELQHAVEAIRHKIEHYGFWQSSQSTMKLCFAALHPQTTDSDAESLAPYKRFLVGLLGRRIESMLGDLIDRLPSFSSRISMFWKQR